MVLQNRKRSEKCRKCTGPGNRSGSVRGSKAGIQVGYAVFGGYDFMGEMLILLGGLDTFMAHEDTEVIHIGFPGLAHVVDAVVGGEIVPQAVGGQPERKLFLQAVHEEPDGIPGKGISTAVEEDRAGSRPGAQFQVGVKLGEGEPAQGNHTVFGTLAGDLHDHSGTVYVTVQETAGFTLAQAGVKHQGNQGTVPGSNPGFGCLNQGEDLPDFIITVNVHDLLGGLRHFDTGRVKGQAVLCVNPAQENAGITDIGGHGGTGYGMLINLQDVPVS